MSTTMKIVVGKSQNTIQNPMAPISPWYGACPAAKYPAKQSEQRTDQVKIRILHILLISPPKLFRKIFLKKSNEGRNH